MTNFELAKHFATDFQNSCDTDKKKCRLEILNLKNVCVN